MTSPEPGFDYPSFYDAAGEASLAGQSQYMAMTAVRSAALIAAALGGAVSWTLGGVEVLAWVALVAFVVALAVEVLVYALTPDKIWYEGRAAAESVKTLSWRYVVGGDPFPHTLSPEQVRSRFLSQLSAVTNDLSYVPPPKLSNAGAITDSMITRRSEPFDERKRLYESSRIVDQINWYTGKSRTNEGNRKLFIAMTIAFEFTGVIAAALRVSQVINFDLLGILAAIVAGIATWSQTRQYGQLASSYSIAAHELESIRAETTSKLEADWPRFVDESEEAISREHTLWRASRGVLRQRRSS